MFALDAKFRYESLIWDEKLATMPLRGDAVRPYGEHLTTPRDASWVFFDRRLERIPFEWHYHPEYELTLTLNSRGQRFVGDNVSAYHHGDLVLIGPKIPHTWCSGERTGRTHRALVLWFTEAFVKSMIEPHVELHPILRLLEKSSRALTFSTATRETAQSAICSMLDQAPAQRLLSLLNLLLLLAGDSRTIFLASAASEAISSPSATEDRISRVISYLHERYREEISVAKLMRTAALSWSSLHRLFKLHTSITIVEYVAQLRVGNACALLLNTQKAVAAIADEVGYRNLANFNRQFKEVKKKTPREFRAAFHR
jgi:AraC-like DNA-binding protein